MSVCELPPWIDIDDAILTFGCCGDNLHVIEGRAAAIWVALAEYEPTTVIEALVRLYETDASEAWHHVRHEAKTLVDQEILDVQAARDLEQVAR